jgi:hypothetical protein
MSSVRYELVSYIPEDRILHCQRRENLRSYICRCHKGMDLNLGVHQCQRVACAVEVRSLGMLHRRCDGNQRRRARNLGRPKGAYLSLAAPSGSFLTEYKLYRI